MILEAPGGTLEEKKVSLHPDPVIQAADVQISSGFLLGIFGTEDQSFVQMERLASANSITCEVG